jgi:hypothetical protein
VNREDWRVVKLVRRVMEERSPVFNCQVQSLVEIRGQDFVVDILVKTIRIEMDGGMMIADGSRRRTRGGIYIKMAKEKLSPEHKREMGALTKAKLKSYAEWEKKRSASLAQKASLEAAAAELELVAEPEIVAFNNAPAPEVIVYPPEPPKQKNEKATKPAATNKRDFAASRQARFQTPVSESTDLRDDLSPHVKAKLQQLQGAANVLRERVQQLESKPAGQQVGLEMARKLLASNESQIAALLAQHERDSEVAS